MEVGFVGGRVIVRRPRACRKKTGAVCLFGIGKKAPPPPPPTLAEQVGAYLKGMKDFIEAKEAEIWNAITQNQMVLTIKKNKAVVAITASPAFWPAVLALAIALGALAVYLLRRRIYRLAMTIVGVFVATEVVGAETSETTTVKAKPLPEPSVPVAAVAVGAAGAAGTSIASRQRRTPPPVAKMPPKKMPPITKMPTKPSTPIVPKAPAKAPPVAKDKTVVPKYSASGNKSATGKAATAPPLKAGAAKPAEPKVEEPKVEEPKAEAATVAPAEEAPDQEYEKLSGEEKKQLFSEELGKQFDEALAEKGLSKDQLGPATLSRTFSIEIPRFRAEDTSVGADGVPGNKRRLSITIPIPMAFLTFAERLNGRLALVGVGVCLLRQLLEPGHPLFTEQLLQTLQLFFILPALLTSSLSSVQVDQSLPPDGSGF